MQPITLCDPIGNRQRNRQTEANQRNHFDDPARLLLDRRRLDDDARQRLTDATERAALGGSHHRSTRRSARDQGA